MNEYWNRPCAASSLKSYRYIGRFGFVMIGARDTDEALREARRSTDNISIYKLEEWDGNAYVPVVKTYLEGLR